MIISIITLIRVSIWSSFLKEKGMKLRFNTFSLF